MDEKRTSTESEQDPTATERDPKPVGQQRGLLRGGRRGPRPRSKFAPIDASLDEVISELSTLEGIKRRRAELYKRARAGGTALELEWCRIEKNLLNEAEKSVREAMLLNESAHLAEQLDAMQRQMTKRSGGGALRRDMATVPPPAPRGKA